MKIRNGFVSNSSSSSFIVSIPHTFKLEDHKEWFAKMLYDLDEDCEYGELSGNDYSLSEEATEKAFNDILPWFNKVQQGDDIWEEELPYVLYQLLYNMCEEFKFMITNVCVSSGGGQIIGCHFNKLTEQIIKLNNVKDMCEIASESDNSGKS